MNALRMVRFLNDLTNEFGPAIPLCQLPHGVLESEARRANGAGAGVSPVGADRVTAATAPHPSRYDNTPPRPSELFSVEDRERWDAAHSDEHTTHRCNLGRMHDGACRCHCGRNFYFDQRGL